MEFVKPPQDIELKNIIDKLAQFVARNGPDFEEMTKTKQKDNPRFEFLFGGEHYHYYRHKVNSEQTMVSADMNNSICNSSLTQPPLNIPPPPGQIPPSPWLNPPQNANPTETMIAQQVALNEQIRESEINLNAQHEVMIQQQKVQIDEAISKTQDENLKKNATDCGLNFTEFDSILQPIVETCTKDAISAGKSWIIQRATAPTPNAVIASYLLRKVMDTDATFNRRLHIIYLLNDTLHHCLRRNANELRQAIQDVIVPMFCTASLNTTDEQQQKLQKLLNLWENKNHYFSQDIIEKLKKPAESLSEYKDKLSEQNSDIIDQITTANKNTYQHYQSQHQAFVNHALQQIQNLEKQKQAIEQHTQQMLSMANNLHTLPTGSFANRPPSPAPEPRKPEESPPPADIREPNLAPPPPPPPPDRRQSSEDEPLLSERLALMMEPRDAPMRRNHVREFTPPRKDFHRMRYTDEEEFSPPRGFNGVGRLPFHQPPPVFTRFSDVPLPDLSRPPPNFNSSTAGIPSLMSLPPPDFLPEDLLPSLPYYELPAGLMVPLVKLEDTNYKPLNPEDIRLPPPAPPSERLLAAVKAFYTPPGHDRPRDSEGWEKLGLYEYYRAKAIAKQQKMDDIESGVRVKSRSPSPIMRLRSRSRSPLTRKRYRSRSRSKSKGRSSRSPPPRPKQANRKSPVRRGRRRERSKSPSYSPDIQRSPTPPSFLNSSYSKLNDKLDESNKGHQMLRKMGWGGAGLGAKEQGIEAPINAGEIRDKTDQYKGVGISLTDPYESFRKSKGQAFITRMKERAEERLTGTN